MCTLESLEYASSSSNDIDLQESTSAFNLMAPNPEELLHHEGKEE